MPRDAESTRLFLALWPDDPTRAALARCRDAWIWDAGARPELDERLHLTLHFLGAVPPQRLPELVDGLQFPFPRFALRLGQPERWSNGVAVLGLEAVSPTLLHLRAALCDRLERLALPVDRRVFRPHVTLARHVGSDATPPSDSVPVRWPVSGYVLVQSLAANRGYVVLRQFG